MDYCPKCGEELSKKNTKFCPKCGKDLSKSGSGNLSRNMIVAIVIVVVAIAIVGLFASGAISFGDSGNVAAADNNTSSDDGGAVKNDESSNGAEASVEYVASSRSDKFHTPDCEWAKKISGSNKITYPNRQAALDGGKIPCQVCGP